MDKKQEYKKSLGLWGLVSLGVGGTIGSGIFVVPGIAAGIAGPSSILSWLIAAISAGSVLLSLAWISGKFPATGAFYPVFSKLFGKKISLFLVVLYIISSILGIATIAAGIGQYLYFFGISDTLTWEISIIIMFTVLNLTGMKLSGGVEILLTALKTIPLIIISILLIQFIKLENFTPFFVGGNLSFLGAIAVVYWSYTGFEISAIPADETKNKKDIPKSLFIVMLMVTFIYLILNIALIGSAGSQTLSNSPAPIAAGIGKFFGYSSVVVAIIGIIAMMSAMNAYIIAASRVMQNISQEYKFPVLQDLSARCTPSNAILLSSIATIALIFLTNSFAVLAVASVITILLPYIFISISAFLLFHSKKIRIIAVIGILSTAAILFTYLLG